MQISRPQLRKEKSSNAEQKQGTIQISNPGHENQATVTWSTSSTSGFSFTSNPGNFSTSVPEVPGVNGVTAPLNFFAEVGQERNGRFFPRGDPVRAAGEPPLPVLQAPTPQQLPTVLADSPGDGLAGLVAVAPDALLVDALG